MHLKSRKPLRVLSKLVVECLDFLVDLTSDFTIHCFLNLTHFTAWLALSSGKCVFLFILYCTFGTIAMCSFMLRITGELSSLVFGADMPAPPAPVLKSTGDAEACLELVDCGQE